MFYVNVLTGTVDAGLHMEIAYKGAMRLIDPGDPKNDLIYTSYWDIFHRISPMVKIFNIIFKCVVV